MFPDVCDILFRPSEANAGDLGSHPRLTPWAALFRRSAASGPVRFSGREASKGGDRHHNRKARGFKMGPAKRQLRSWSQVSSQPCHSSEGAKECSPRRKAWVPPGKKDQLRRGERNGTQPRSAWFQIDPQNGSSDRGSSAEPGVHSSEGAKECSPRRKAWVTSGKKRTSPGGAKETAHKHAI
jgi:hypothetical protein